MFCTLRKIPFYNSVLFIALLLTKCTYKVLHYLYCIFSVHYARNGRHLLANKFFIGVGGISIQATKGSLACLPARRLYIYKLLSPVYLKIVIRESKCYLWRHYTQPLLIFFAFCLFVSSMYLFRMDAFNSKALHGSNFRKFML